MVDAPRITAAEVKKRIAAGEEIVFIDARNPQAWAESDVKVPHAIRASDNLDEIVSKVPKNDPMVAYCT